MAVLVVCFTFIQTLGLLYYWQPPWLGCFKQQSLEYLEREEKLQIVFCEADFVGDYAFDTDVIESWFDFHDPIQQAVLTRCKLNWQSRVRTCHVVQAIVKATKHESDTDFLERVALMRVLLTQLKTDETERVMRTAPSFLAVRLSCKPGSFWLSEYSPLMKILWYLMCWVLAIPNAIYGIPLATPNAVLA